MSANGNHVADPARFRAVPTSGPRAGKHRVPTLTQVLDLKDVAYQDGTNAKTLPHIKAALMRAYVDLTELAMNLRGHGKPKPVEARNAAPKRKVNETAPIVYPGPSTASQAAVVGERKAE